MGRIVLQSQKEMLFEDMMIYAGVGIVDITWDVLLNLLANTRLFMIPHEPLGHAYNFGLFQVIILAFCIWQIIRKWKQYRHLA